MTEPYYQDKQTTIYCGHVLDMLKQMDPESIQCVVTSPPYWGLRDYGLEPQVWGGDQECGHEWGDIGPKHHPGQVQDNKAVTKENAVGQNAGSGQFCLKCGAWRGNLGLEPTPELYVQHLVEIFQEVRRVLRKDGTLFLNLGDSYAGSGKGGQSEEKRSENWQPKYQNKGITPIGYKPKDLCMIPFRVAMALQADGWYLRSIIPWLKRNPMPESCKDRPTTAVEYVFLLSKNQQYFYDAEAVKIPHSPDGRQDTEFKGSDKYANGFGPGSSTNPIRKHERWPGSGRNLRNSDFFFKTWQGLLSDEEGDPMALAVNPKGYKEAHFATFPPMLVDPMIKAGTSERGCCPECGAPWGRIVNKIPTGQTQKKADGWATHRGGHGSFHRDGRERGQGGQPMTKTKTMNWQPTCKCGQESTIPCTVLDPFAGSGTVGMMAKKLGRKAILIDAKEEYCDMMIERLPKQERLLLNG